MEEYQTLVVARLFGVFRQLPVIENESDKKPKENIVHSSLLVVASGVSGRKH